MCERWMVRGAILLGTLGLLSASPQSGAQESHRHEEPEHQAPTAKRDPNRLWCNAHGVYEDQCFICHPELEGRPEVEPDDQDTSDHDHPDGRETRGDLLWCREHNVAERECGICQPQLAGELIPGQGMKVRLPSRDSAKKAGIRTAVPREIDIAASFNVYCEVHYNQNRLARITPLVTGVIHRVHVDLGQRVLAGELLVEIASPEVAAAKRDYLVALVGERLKKLAFEREKELTLKEISSAQSYQLAEGEYEMARIGTLSARQKLVNFGFTELEADEVAETRSSSSIVHVHAPFDGTLVERSSVLGEFVKPGSPLFTLADLSTMWLTLSVPESKVALVRSGLQIEATFSALPGVIATGVINWVDVAVSEPSRMVAARVEVDNADGLLRNNLFGESRVLLGAGATALSVPRESVQRFERNPFVFVKLDEDLFELRRVALGNATHDRIQIVQGLRPEDPVVAAGSFIMMSEFLKSRLGAGCVDD